MDENIGLSISTSMLTIFVCKSGEAPIFKTEAGKDIFVKDRQRANAD